MARIVVAGASGLTGLALVQRLAGEHEVIAVARRAAPEGLPRGVAWLTADVGAPGWSEVLPNRYDAVFALFQSPDFRDFPARANDVFRTNVGGLQELLGHAGRADAKRFVFTSTGGLYAASEQPLTEDSPLTTAGPLGFYLTTKRCGELLVESHASLFSTLIVRPFFIYGPGQATGMLLPRLIDSVRSGKPLGLQGRDGLSINPIHASDAAALLANALPDGATGVVNLAGPEAASLRRIGGIIGERLGIAPRFDVNESAAAPFVVADIAKMQAMLGAPKIGLEEGIATMLADGAPSR
jgi:UDP-glucose 4-epimerase